MYIIRIVNSKKPQANKIEENERGNIIIYYFNLI